MIYYVLQTLLLLPDLAEPENKTWIILIIQISNFIFEHIPSFKL